MPTGYTADIAKGITFEQYALNCARAFGALIMMRDEPSDAPIPDKFEPSDYALRAMTETQVRILELEAMTADDVTHAAQTAYDRELENYNRYLAEKRELRQKYEAMLEQARKYQAPSPDHIEYKKFMEDQLTKSIEFDCSESYLSVPEKLSAPVWFEKEITQARERLERHKKSHAEEVARTDSRNSWVALLRQSLNTSYSKEK